jgi:hypothetical protein
MGNLLSARMRDALLLAPCTARIIIYINGTYSVFAAYVFQGSAHGDIRSVLRHTYAETEPGIRIDRNGRGQLLRLWPSDAFGSAKDIGGTVGIVDDGAAWCAGYHYGTVTRNSDRIYPVAQGILGDGIKGSGSVNFFRQI